MTISDILSHSSCASQASKLVESKSSWISTSFFGARKRISIIISNDCTLQIKIVAQNAFAHFFSRLLSNLSCGYTKDFGVYPIREFALPLFEETSGNEFRSALIKHVAIVLDAIQTKTQMQEIIDNEKILINALREIHQKTAPKESVSRLPIITKLENLAPNETALIPLVEKKGDPVLEISLETTLNQSDRKSGIATVPKEPGPIKTVYTTEALSQPHKAVISKRSPYAKLAIVGAIAFASLAALGWLNRQYSDSIISLLPGNVISGEDALGNKKASYVHRPEIERALMLTPKKYLKSLPIKRLIKMQPDPTQLFSTLGLHLKGGPHNAMLPFHPYNQNPFSFCSQPIVYLSENSPGWNDIRHSIIFEMPKLPFKKMLVKHLPNFSSTQSVDTALIDDSVLIEKASLISNNNFYFHLAGLTLGGVALCGCCPINQAIEDQTYTYDYTQTKGSSSENDFMDTQTVVEDVQPNKYKEVQPGKSQEKGKELSEINTSSSISDTILSSNDVISPMSPMNTSLYEELQNTLNYKNFEYEELEMKERSVEYTNESRQIDLSEIKRIFSLILEVETEIVFLKTCIDNDIMQAEIEAVKLAKEKLENARKILCHDTIVEDDLVKLKHCLEDADFLMQGKQEYLNDLKKIEKVNEDFFE